MGQKPKTKMTPAQRAKQFAPFDALAGFGLALREVERRMCLESKKELSGEEKEKIGRFLRNVHKGTDLSVRFFDHRETDPENMGTYVTVSGPAEDISFPFAFLVIRSRTIRFADIYSLDFAEEAPPSSLAGEPCADASASVRLSQNPCPPQGANPPPETPDVDETVLDQAFTEEEWLDRAFPDSETQEWPDGDQADPDPSLPDRAETFPDFPS